MNKILRDALLALALACAAHGLALAAGRAGPATDAVPSTVAHDTCNWNHPGVNPFMGDVVAAVDRYQDIPADVRARLKARMAKREYDDLVSIRRDSIGGRGGYDYGSTISEMHFGTNQLCHAVTRAAWSPTMEERGLVYCESGHCILVPTVCRNVSRVTRKAAANEVAGTSFAEEASPAFALAEPPPIDWFGPTGAGDPAMAGQPQIDWFGPTGAGGSGGPTVAGPPTDGAYGGHPVFADGGSFTPNHTGPARRPTFTPIPAIPPDSNPPGRPPVAAVPEPQTWVFMFGGLAALLVTARRRGLRRPAAVSGSAR
jgi:hypothetical protein